MTGKIVENEKLSFKLRPQICNENRTLIEKLFDNFTDKESFLENIAITAGQNVVCVPLYLLSEQLIGGMPLDAAADHRIISMFGGFFAANTAYLHWRENDWGPAWDKIRNKVDSLFLGQKYINKFQKMKRWTSSATYTALFSAGMFTICNMTHCLFGNGSDFNLNNYISNLGLYAASGYLSGFILRPAMETFRYAFLGSFHNPNSMLTKINIKKAIAYSALSTYITLSTISNLPDPKNYGREPYLATYIGEKQHSLDLSDKNIDNHRSEAAKPIILQKK